MNTNNYLLYLNLDLIFNIYNIDNKQTFIDKSYPQKYILSILTNLVEVNMDEQNLIHPFINFKFVIKKIFTNNNYDLSNNLIYKKFEENHLFTINVQINDFNKNLDVNKLCSIYTNLNNFENLHGEYNFTDINSQVYFMELIEPNSNCSSLESSVSSLCSVESENSVDSFDFSNLKNSTNLTNSFNSSKSLCFINHDQNIFNHDILQISQEFTNDLIEKTNCLDDWIMIDDIKIL